MIVMDSFMQSTWYFQIFGVAVLAYTFSIIIYRLYFHPLHKFPGPRLAAISTLYELYFQYVRDRQFTFEVERMHQKYGPVVRINPRELHIADPDFYEQIYSRGPNKRDKDPEFVPIFAAPHASIAAVDHDLHKARARVMRSYFSQQSIRKREPAITYCIDKLLQRFEGARKTGECVTLNNAFNAMTGDIITRYAYGRDLGFLDDPVFKLKWKDAVSGALQAGVFFRFFPLLDVFKIMPEWLVLALNPGVAEILYIEHLVREQVRERLATTKTNEAEDTIFDALIDPSVPAEYKTLDRLTDEGHILLIGGSETTANTLTTIAFHLLSNPPILTRLRGELQDAMPDRDKILPWSELEQLPFLHGVIKEGLRLGMGVSSRLPRVAPNENLQCGEWIIPAGTPMSTMTYIMHMNPSIFPTPEKFDPERWITASRRGQNLERYLVSFTRGTRECIGIRLAYSELYLTTATLFRKLDMELYETTDKDCRFSRDCFFPGPTRGSKGVRVIIK